MDNSVKPPPAEARQMRYITAAALLIVGSLVYAGFYSVATVAASVYIAYWLVFSTWYSVNSMGVHGAMVYGALLVVLSVLFAIGLGIHRGHAEELSLNGIAQTSIRGRQVVSRAGRLFHWGKAGKECYVKPGTRYLEERRDWRRWHVQILITAEPKDGVGNDGCKEGDHVKISRFASSAGIKALARQNAAGGGKQ